MYNIIGQDELIEELKKSIEKDNLSHAYLFNGEKGVGKKLLSKEFSAMILCKNEDFKQRPCGSCSSCHKILTDNHPDIHFLKPEKSQYTVEQFDIIQELIRRKPNESRKNIFIFEEGDKLSISFQNKFLKILEEPPETTVIIVLIDNKESLLKTTLSRLRTIDIKPISIDLCEKHLISEYKNIEDLRLICQISNGNIGKAKELIIDENFKINRKKIIDLSKNIIEHDKIKTLETFDFFEKEKENIDETLRLMENWFRDILIYIITNEEKKLMNLDKISIIKEQSKAFSSKKVYRTIEIIEDLKFRLHQNTNYSSSITRFLIDLSNI